MAYSNVGTPVFYIDNYLYHKTIGTTLTEGIPADVYNMKPQITTTIDAGFNIQLPVSPINYNLYGNMKYYIAFLNHDIGTSSGYIDVQTIITDENDVQIISDFDVIRGGWANYQFINGSTILAIDTAHDTSFYKLNNSGAFNLGAISTGIQYTMPHSPDLNLNMEIEFDGIKTITTSGGGSISNVRYSGNPLWVNGVNKTNPFDVYDTSLDVTTAGARRNGRKSWSLKFSYIADTDLFSSNPKASSYTEHPNDSTYNDSDLNPEGGASDGSLAYNIETDDSFYAQVWNKTLGGALPFIFQPDSNDRDDFYICKFNQKSLKISQSAYKVYDISLKIEEVWS